MDALEGLGGGRRRGEVVLKLGLGWLDRIEALEDGQGGGAEARNGRVGLGEARGLSAAAAAQDSDDRLVICN